MNNSLCAADLFSIEAMLSQPAFAGVPLGASLGDIYLHDLYLNKRRGNWTGGLKERVMESFHLRQPIAELRGRRSPVPGDYGGLFLLSLQRDEPRFSGLVAPLVEALSPAECLIIGRDEARPKWLPELPESSGYLSFEKTPSLELPAWRSEFKKARPGLIAAVNAVVARYDLPGAEGAKLRLGLVAQAQRLWAYRDLLRQLKPRAVIVEYDRNTRSSCLVLAARVLGIPSATLVHGVINPPYGYTPLLADVIYCWGEIQRGLLLQMGAPPERIVVAGCPRLSRKLDADPRAARVKADLNPDSTVALNASSPIALANKLELADDFCRAIGSIAGMSAVIRLHPSESLNDYQQVIASHPGVKVLPSSVWSLDESLAAADVVVVRDSGYGNDALIKGKPVVILNSIGGELSNGRQLAGEGGCPVALNDGDLASLVKRIIGDETYRGELAASRERFVSRYCRAFGADAAAAIAGDIRVRLMRSSMGIAV